ncbi:MAG TPA: bifunctional metallophosphatase/5'-nucleotidase, partial [Levilinea sp.]|nr:bifunctional metallophosphatase/5'-nucleotidase [Levilinea sp.]
MRNFLIVMLVLTMLTVGVMSAAAAPKRTVEVQILAVNDFHGNLEPPSGSSGRIDALLEQQCNNPAPGQNRILQVSEGLTYEWSASAAVGNKVDPTSIKLNGITLDPNGLYRVTMNSFLADGGDNFSVFTQGTNRVGGVVDTSTLEAYFQANSPVAPVLRTRSVQI